MFADILIEIVVVKKNQDHTKYYVYSNIKDISKTIIKGNSDTHNILSDAVSQFSPDIKELKSETIKRLMYFVLSLERIAKKGDRYKFFFHNNIIIHEITRLLYFSDNRIEYDYLPPDALDYYNAINIKDLLYDFTKDEYKHILAIKNIGKKVLEKIGCHEDKYFAVLKDTEKRHNGTQHSTGGTLPPYR